MSLFPISAVTRRTGISLDTLRAWERRYQAVSPARGARGRMYTEAQVQRLLLLRKAVDQGHAIGQIVKFGESHLRKLVDLETASPGRAVSLPGPNQAAPPADLESDILAPVFRALDRYDYAAADREISRLAVALAQPREFVHHIALPLMRRIGQMWHRGRCSIAQEHMLTNLLSAVLSSMIRTYTPTDPRARVLLATPRDNHHAFPILVSAMLTAVHGLGVVYLGTDLPAADIILAARRGGANAVLLSLASDPDPQTLKELALIARRIPRSTALWLGGAPELKLSPGLFGPRWQMIDNFFNLEHYLDALGPAGKT